MARKVIYKENGLLNSTDTPTGYRYLGYDDTALSEKDGSTVTPLANTFKTHKMTMTTGSGDGSISSPHGLGNINILSISSFIDDGTYQIPNMFNGSYPQNSFYSVIAKGSNIELRYSSLELNILNSTVNIFIIYESI